MRAFNISSSGKLAAALLLACTAPAAGEARGQETTAFPPDTGIHRDTLDASEAQPFVLQPLIVPGSERILRDGAAIPSSGYRIDYRFGRLWIHDPTGTLVAEYRTLPFALRDTYRLRTIVARDTMPSPSAEERLQQMRPVDRPRLQHSGSITRGVLAGNNRDVTLESGLRMQLSGEIVEGVNVQAVLTDENTPILPEGTTQRLEEFDRVFIGIEAPFGVAQLGDFDLRFGETEFARFARKLQGASMTAQLPRGPTFAEGSVTVAGATARGVFRSQTIEPIDGVQGPYRMEGSQGERFILVVPGTEEVYVDGNRLTRGETNDYTIDYSTAEVTFTPNVMVTADLRIKVEFQYSTSRFTRTLLGSQVESRFWRRERGGARARLGATVIREADSRQFGEEFGFSSADSLALTLAGDGFAASGGAERVEFDPEAPFVQYRLERRGVDTVFVALDRAPGPGEPVFRVQFSRVGDGQGSYVRVGRSINGILYEFRGPGNGAYLPIRILPKPKHQRLIDFHGAVEPLERLEFFGEWARSLHDENRLSPLDAVDDLGDAYLVGARLQPATLGPARISGELRRRFTGSSFEAFDRIRPVEFERRWNLLSRSTTATGGVLGGGDETINEGNLRVEMFEATHLQGETGRLVLGGAFEGVRNAAYLYSAEAGLPELDYRAEFITSMDSLAGERGRWVRQLGLIRYPLRGGRLAPRVEIEHEDRRQRVIGTDSLALQSFQFVEVRPGVDWRSERLELGGFLEMRAEDDWIGGGVADAATSWSGQTQFRYRPSATFDVDGNVGFRLRRFTERFQAEQNREDAESLILRWNSRYQPLKRALQLNWLYEGTSERTPTLQEIYIRTGPEIGQFVWEDVNGDGVIQIDEFLPERLPNEGTYVKTFVPSDSLTAVVNVQTRLRLEFEPSRLWTAPSAEWQYWLSNVSSRTVVEIREKTRDPRLARVYLLDLRRFRDPDQTMNGRIRLAQDLFFFRNKSDYGVDVSFNQLRSLTKMSAGEELRFLNTWSVEGRLRPPGSWSVRARAAMEQNRLLSESFASRRYDIKSVRLEPEASYGFSPNLQVVASPEFGRKRDVIETRSAWLVKLPLELRYTRPRKMQATGRFEVARVELEGIASGLAQYELTDGRGPGTSYLWGLRGQYSLNEFLRATFSYDGRAPAGTPPIHTMQVQLSAMF